MPTSLVTIAEMRAWEGAAWRVGVKPESVIARVGQKVAQRLREWVKPSESILFLAGRGHNGDDARAAAALLTDRQCTVLNVEDPGKDMAPFWEIAESKPDWVIDGLFGIGLNRPLENPWIDFLQAVAGLESRVIAIDVPSGLHADSGEIMGYALPAEITLALGRVKQGLVVPGASAVVGRLELIADIGLLGEPEAQNTTYYVGRGDFHKFPPVREADSHKGTFGHVVMLGGVSGYHGAAVLAAQGALRAQPGLVSLVVDSPVYLPVASQLSSVMVHPWNDTVMKRLTAQATALVVGPGLVDPVEGVAMRQWVRDQWAHFPGPMVVDASALPWIHNRTDRTVGVRIMTPHPGEAGRMLSLTSAQINENRTAALKAISEKFCRAWVILKGHGTLIGHSEGEIWLNSSGNPHLAQGGSGDVLAGFLGGLLAQPPLWGELQRTLAYAVYEHGEAADRIQHRTRGWGISELVSELGRGPGS